MASRPWTAGRQVASSSGGCHVARLLPIARRAYFSEESWGTVATGDAMADIVRPGTPRLARGPSQSLLVFPKRLRLSRPPNQRPVPMRVLPG